MSILRPLHAAGTAVVLVLSIACGDAAHAGQDDHAYRVVERWAAFPDSVTA